MRQILLVLFCALALLTVGLFVGISKVNTDAGFIYAQY
jgi:hypothetical protein